MTDWAAIRAEYIAGGTSYRKLAQKYSVSFSTVKRRAKVEGWTALQAQAYALAATKSALLTADAAATYDQKIYQTADKLLNRVGEAIDCIDSTDTGGMRQLASVLRDLQDIKGLRCDLNRREQEARIAKLRREVEREDDNRVVEIRLSGELQEYSE